MFNRSAIVIAKKPLAVRVWAFGLLNERGTTVVLPVVTTVYAVDVDRISNGYRDDSRSSDSKLLHIRLGILFVYQKKCANKNTTQILLSSGV